MTRKSNEERLGDLITATEATKDPKLIRTVMSLMGDDPNAARIPLLVGVVKRALSGESVDTKPLSRACADADKKRLRSALGRAEAKANKRDQPARLRKSLERTAADRAKKEHQERRAEIKRKEERAKVWAGRPWWLGRNSFEKDMEEKGWRFLDPPEPARPFVSTPTPEKKRPIKFFGVVDLDGFSSLPTGVVLSTLRKAQITTYDVAGVDCIDPDDRQRAEEALAVVCKQRLEAAAVASEKARQHAEAKEDAFRKNYMDLDELAERAGLDVTSARKKLAWYWGQPRVLRSEPLMLGLPRPDGERLLMRWRNEPVKSQQSAEPSVTEAKMTNET